MNTLTIARYKDGYIKINEYNRSIHKNGEIFCPFCNPSLEVTGVENKFFRALPNRGGHNCGRRAVEYFNAEWEGRQLIETVKGDEGKIEIVIDINSLDKMRKGFSNIGIPQKTKDKATNNDMEAYNRYKTYKKVFRDIVRTVYQMKMLIEKNSIDDLGKINFKYKMGNEELGINDVVIPVDELNKNLHNKERFVIYIVDTVKVNNGKIYINSYETEGNIITTSFSYPSKRNQTGIKKDDMIIAFGSISYYERTDQYYLNILSDLNIVKMNDNELNERFSNKKMNKREFVKKNIVLESNEQNIDKVDFNKASILKDITLHQNNTERDQKNQLSAIKEYKKKDIQSDGYNEYGSSPIERETKKKSLLNKFVKNLFGNFRKR